MKSMHELPDGTEVKIPEAIKVRGKPSIEAWCKDQDRLYEKHQDAVERLKGGPSEAATAMMPRRLPVVLSAADQIAVLIGKVRGRVQLLEAAPAEKATISKWLNRIDGILDETVTFLGGDPIERPDDEPDEGGAAEED